MQVPAPVIWTIQQFLDSAMKLDPQVREELISLDQRIIRIEETGFGFSVCLLVVDGTIQVLGHHDGDVDTVVRGSAPALLSLSKDTKGVFTGDVTLEGDIGVGREARKLMASLDIDWEEQLSKVTGDSIAHQVGRLHRGFFDMISRTGIEFRRDATEYLTEETDLVIGPIEVSGFLTAVDSLRDDAERLEARIVMMEDRLGRD